MIDDTPAAPAAPEQDHQPKVKCARCPATAQNGKRLCARCSMSENQRHRDTIRQHAKAGLCTRCPRRAARGKRRCIAHLKSAAAATAKYKQARQAQQPG